MNTEYLKSAVFVQFFFLAQLPSSKSGLIFMVHNWEILFYSFCDIKGKLSKLAI